MVGIVIVTHSRELAESVITLAREMLRDEVPLASAGGVDDHEHPFGTDAMKILSAIESIYSDDGVLVLMDMGSAILSAGTAIDFLTSEQKSHVLLCEAPLVEGTVAAAVCAEGGGTLEEVSREARAALQVKREQLGGERFEEPVEKHPYPASLPHAGEKETIRVTVVNPLGIHARPAAALVSTASRFESTISISHAGSGSAPVDARSINAVSLLGARQGDELVLSASGSDAHAALEELGKLVQNGFGENDHSIEKDNVSVRGREGSGKGELSGIGASPGIALAPCMFFKPRLDETTTRNAGKPEEEWEKLTAAMDAVKLDLRSMMSAVAARAGDEHASIFHAHLLVLEDEEFLHTIRTHVHAEKMRVEQAWTASVDELIRSYSRLESSYQRERVHDLEDLRRQVLSMLTGRQSRSFEIDHEAIVIAADLTPSDVALMDCSKVVGLCAAFGSSTSHSAILARALGIPAVVGLGPEILRVSEGSTVAMDGKEGSVWIDPENPDLFSFRRARWLESREGPAVIKYGRISYADGREIRIFANISSVSEAERAVQLGADGVGVLRTEFLFMHRSYAPSEKEQVEIYRSIAETMGARPLVIRTLDAGGDKPLSYVSMKTEANPFLGVRGLRLSLEQPELFSVQLRAILRAGTGKDVAILLPMVSSIEEVRHAREYLVQVQRDLINDHLAFSREVKLGIMVEVPAAALIAGHLAGEVDFMSIGTNDLSQYVMSADRSSEQVSSLCDPLHPAVLHLIKKTAQACSDSGICAGVCGEIAADIYALPLLLGFGINELSMNPYAIPRIKEAVSELDPGKASFLAEEALKLGGGMQVRRLVAETLSLPCEDTGAY